MILDPRDCPGGPFAGVILMDIDSNDLKEYAKRMEKIRHLSTPPLEEIEDAGEYSKVLLHNFSLIGELAAENRKVIEGLIKANNSTEAALDPKIKEKFEEFSDILFDAYSIGEVDVHLSNLITDLLMQDEIRLTEDNEDINVHVISIAKKVKRDYFLLSGLTRFYTDKTEDVRKKAIENMNELLSYLKKDRFAELNDEAKETALHFSLNGALLFESTDVEKPIEYWDQCIDILEEESAILNDPFYRDRVPEYDWEAHEFRIYYYGSFLAYSILPKEIAKKAFEYAKKAVDYLENCKREDITSAVSIENELDLKLLSEVQAGYRSARDACDIFYDAYEKRDPSDYSVTGINKNLDTPSSYLRVSKMGNMELTKEDAERYYNIERSVIDYLHLIPKEGDTYLKCVTLITNLPLYYREAPGAMPLEEFMLKAFAAIHPPTYIHVNMVADITESLVRNLFEYDPSQFIGFPGCDTLEKVLEAKEEIKDFAYHAALNHDLGKLFIIDVITMYGRSLLDDEFDMIKNHPVVGAKVAEENESTRKYVDIIRGHHLWYDCSRGYPYGTDTFKSPYKTIIDLVLAADCLDAATDTVGRSYNKGKNFEDYIKEVTEGAGTHYAPFLPDFLKSPGVKQDVMYLLTERRAKLYKDTFNLLRNNELENIKARFH